MSWALCPRPCSLSVLWIPDSASAFQKVAFTIQVSLTSQSGLLTWLWATATRGHLAPGFLPSSFPGSSLYQRRQLEVLAQDLPNPPPRGGFLGPERKQGGFPGCCRRSSQWQLCRLFCHLLSLHCPHPLGLTKPTLVLPFLQWLEHGPCGRPGDPVLSLVGVVIGVTRGAVWTPQPKNGGAHCPGASQERTLQPAALHRGYQ